MNINDLASKLGVTPARIKVIATSLFGTDKNLTEAQIEQLTDKLQSAASIAALPPAQRQSELLEIKSIDPIEATSLERTIKTVGINVLRRSQEAIDKVYSENYLKQIADIEDKEQQFTNQVTQFQYARRAKTNLDIAKNIKAIDEEFETENFSKQLEKTKNTAVSRALTDEDIEFLELELKMM